jgi:hypothetical protein
LATATSFDALSQPPRVVNTSVTLFPPIRRSRNLSKNHTFSTEKTECRATRMRHIQIGVAFRSIAKKIASLQFYVADDYRNIVDRKEVNPKVGQLPRLSSCRFSIPFAAQKIAFLES